jgi:hypothetical protein
MNSTASSNNITIGDKIKVSLTLDEAVTLAGVGHNKITIAGKEFLLLVMRINSLYGIKLC